MNRQCCGREARSGGGRGRGDPQPQKNRRRKERAAGGFTSVAAQFPSFFFFRPAVSFIRGVTPGGGGGEKRKDRTTTQSKLEEEVDLVVSLQELSDFCPLSAYSGKFKGAFSHHYVVMARYHTAVHKWSKFLFLLHTSVSTKNLNASCVS